MQKIFFFQDRSNEKNRLIFLTLNKVLTSIAIFFNSPFNPLIASSISFFSCASLSISFPFSSPFFPSFFSPFFSIFSASLFSPLCGTVEGTEGVEEVDVVTEVEELEGDEEGEEGEETEVTEGLPLAALTFLTISK